MLSFFSRCLKLCKQLTRHRLAFSGMIFLIVMILSCFLLPTIGQMLGIKALSHDANISNLNQVLQTPSANHWLGTDPQGRDLLLRILHGGKISLSIGIAATIIALIIGTIYGGIAGYIGGKIDSTMMRVVDILYALPFLVLVIIFSIYLKGSFSTLFADPKTNYISSTMEQLYTILSLLLTIGILGWLTIARIVRAQVLFYKKQDFVAAALSLGLSHSRIFCFHILPNALGPIIVYTTLTIPSFIMFEATLSFLGLGIQSPSASWGNLINNGINYLETAPYILIFPALFFISTLFAFNLLGDGLRDILDPKSKKSS